MWIIELMQRALDRTNDQDAIFALDRGITEVERLRAALSFIAMARQPSMGQTWESHAIEMADYAAERLKEKP